MPKYIPHYTRDFAQFVDDLGGFLWAMKVSRMETWKEMAAVVGVTPPTLIKLANRVTQNPQLYTCWKILRGLDRASVIRHSQLEQYRGLAEPKKAA
jgi:DNA-binding XRE family transcriptional regulator